MKLPHPTPAHIMACIFDALDKDTRDAIAEGKQPIPVRTMAIIRVAVAQANREHAQENERDAA